VESRQHALGVLLLFSLRSDDQEVEDHDNQTEGDDHGDHLIASTCRRLQDGEREKEICHYFCPLQYEISVKNNTKYG
jgi:hypothetical protein